MRIRRNPDAAGRGPKDRFTGDVWLWPRIGGTEHADVRLALFTPGARSVWHRHPGGQVLHVTEGAGLVQSHDGTRDEIRAGDTVTTEPGEWHWHGAAPDAFMVHLAVTDGTTEWGGEVTDDQYRRSSGFEGTGAPGEDGPLGEGGEGRADASGGGHGQDRGQGGG